jgi:hypothetical protein
MNEHTMTQSLLTHLAFNGVSESMSLLAPTQKTEFQVPRFPGHIECQIRGDYCESHPPACFRRAEQLAFGRCMNIFFIILIYEYQVPRPLSTIRTNKSGDLLLISHPTHTSPPSTGGASTWSTTMIHRCARTNWVSRRCVAQRIGLCQPVPLTPRGQEVAW